MIIILVFLYMKLGLNIHFIKDFKNKNLFINFSNNEKFYSQIEFYLCIIFIERIGIRNILSLLKKNNQKNNKN